MQYRYAITILILCAWFAAVPCEGSDLYPSEGLDVSGIFQTAGYSGYTAFGLGLGYSRFSSDILLGYVPESEEGEEIWSVTVKLNMTFIEVHNNRGTYGGYIGLRLFYSFDEDTFVQLPEKYPDHYYPVTAFRTALALGVESGNRDYSWFVEVCCLDLYLEAKIRNWNHLGWDEVLSYGMGYRYYFGS